ncbi:TPA: hypothetical protein ACH3X1_012584 [Trebouxia sp. C0004]
MDSTQLGLPCYVDPFENCTIGMMPNIGKTAPHRSNGICVSVAVWLVWKSRAEKQELALPLTVFGASLALGNWWNVVFMGRHQMKPSLKWMGAFWLSIAGVIGSFHPFSPLAAALVAPTQLWVTVAAKLNYDIVKLNTGKDGRT